MIVKDSGQLERGEKGRCKREEKMGNYSINIYLTKNQTNLNFLPFLRRFR